MVASASSNFPSQVIRFGVFDADLHAAELRKAGAKLKLEGQPFQILALLLKHPGEVVTREELQQQLWPADTFVDFEHSINTAVKRLREALDDSADTPRYIETLPRRGYRFIYPVNGVAAIATSATTKSRQWLAVGVTAVLLILGLTLSIPTVRDRLLGLRVPGKSLRVAVLPLMNLSGDPEQDYFAAGMTEMLITELGAIAALQVTSHQSVLSYANSTKPLPQIARELGVDALVEGTVQRSGDRLRVTVNFVQVNPENHLLAKSYPKNVRDVLALQEEVAWDIAGAIRVNLPKQSTPSSPARQFVPEAIEAYLRGAYVLAKGTDKDRDEARTYLEKAIEIDPAFARPYATLALVYSHGGAVRAGGSGAGRTPTRQWAEKALQLDDSLAEAHAALAWLSISDWDFPRAEREFKRAIELNPSLAQARAWYAQFLGIMNRYPEAFTQAEIALQLAPGAPNTVSHAVEPYLTGGRADDAISHWREIIRLHPDYWGAHYFLALGHIKKGMYREAVGEAEETIRLSERSPNNLSLLASAYAMTSDREKSLRVLHELEDQLRQRGGGNEGALARAHAALNENEKALALLEQAYSVHRPGLAFVNTWPQLDSLRSDPRFRDLLRRIGLPPGNHGPLANAGKGSSK